MAKHEWKVVSREEIVNLGWSSSTEKFIFWRKKELEHGDYNYACAHEKGTHAILYRWVIGQHPVSDDSMLKIETDLPQHPEAA